GGHGLQPSLGKGPSLVPCRGRRAMSGGRRAGEFQATDPGLPLTERRGPTDRRKGRRRQMDKAVPLDRRTGFDRRTLRERRGMSSRQGGGVIPAWGGQP